MEKYDITDFMDAYGIFLRIKGQEPRKDFVVLPEGKGKSGRDGKDRKLFA